MNKNSGEFVEQENLPGYVLKKVLQAQVDVTVPVFHIYIYIPYKMTTYTNATRKKKSSSKRTDSKNLS